MQHTNFMGDLSIFTTTHTHTSPLRPIPPQPQLFHWKPFGTENELTAAKFGRNQMRFEKTESDGEQSKKVVTVTVAAKIAKTRAHVMG